jgi:hypothetical protein
MTRVSKLSVERREVVRLHVDPALTAAIPSLGILRIAT